jgi:hypothetical protein
MSDPERGGGAAARLHARATQVLSLAMVVIGVALIARLATLSLILGILFLAAGAGRLYLGSSLRGRVPGDRDR